MQNEGEEKRCRNERSGKDWQDDCKDHCSATVHTWHLETRLQGTTKGPNGKILALTQGHSVRLLAGWHGEWTYNRRCGCSIKEPFEKDTNSQAADNEIKTELHHFVGTQRAMNGLKIKGQRRLHRLNENLPRCVR